jgi:hypothetical protein
LIKSTLEQHNNTIYYQKKHEKHNRYHSQHKKLTNWRINISQQNQIEGTWEEEKIDYVDDDLKQKD